MVARDSLNPSPPPPLVDDACDTTITDPPPPYPSRERRSRTVRSSRGHSGRVQISHHTDHEVRVPPLSSYVVDENNAREPDETTPFLSPRPRSFSHASTMSGAPSLAHTVLSLFQLETDDGVHLDDDRQFISSGDDNGSLRSSQSHSTAFFYSAAWKRYFRPIISKSYYTALFHLVVVNFPYALAAWIYLFIFTVVRFFFTTILDGFFLFTT